jgi:hypothetical protein
MECGNMRADQHSLGDAFSGEEFGLSESPHGGHNRLSGRRLCSLRRAHGDSQAPASTVCNLLKREDKN